MNYVSMDRKLSPVYNLPPEILEEIFVRSLPAFPVLSHDVAPLLLCSVCSSWRNVALHSSRLWSSISIDMSDLISKSSPDSGCSEVIPPVIQFLRLSKNRPLSVRISAASPALFDHPEWKFRFELFLDQFHNRIQELNLSSSWLGHLLHSIPQDIAFPQLSTMTVASSSGPSFDSLTTPFMALANCELLRQFTYKAYISRDTVVNMAIPWSQLTHITLTDIDYVPWTYIFLRCRNLQSGTFIISGAPQAPPKSNIDITFPSLTHLSIHSIQTSRTPLSLRGYSFPNLKELQLGWNHSPGFDTSFLSTIHNLESLVISSPQCHFINMGEVLSILSLTPSISALHVSNNHCSRELFDPLAYHPHHQRPLLPRLRTLTVETSQCNSICDEIPMLKSLERMVFSRCQVTPDPRVERLEVLRMITPKQNLDGVKQSLQVLTTTGLSQLVCTPVRAGDEEERRHNRN